MTDKQRVAWDVEQYKRKLEANRGHNYEYWTDKHDKMLDNGWYILNTTTIEGYAKDWVHQFRKTGHFARIVCGYEKNLQRVKHYTVIVKEK